MNKRFLSLLLVVAMLASLVVFPAYAEPAGTVLTAETVLKDGGSYYLDTDVVRDTLTVDGISVTIDLNGHVLRATHGQRMLEVKGAANVTITDSSAAKSGEMQATGVDADKGGVVLISGGTLNINGGTLRQLYDANIAVIYGGVLAATAACTINMTDGKITDGFVATKVNSSGGNVRITNNITFNMFGGEITNGHAWNGGGVYVAGSGKFKMTGGHIYNNVAYNTDPANPNTNYGDGCGGNIWTEGTLTISGSAIVEKGVAAKFGGNIYSKTANTVLDGVTGIQGDIYTTTALTLKGDVNIPMGNSNGLMMANGVKQDFSQLDLAKMQANEHYIYFGVNLASEGSAVFTANGGATYKDVLRNVGRTTSVTEDANGELVAARFKDGGPKETVNESWCPHCREYVEWKRVGLFGNEVAEGVTHYYNYNNQTAKAITGEFVVDLCGLTLSRTTQIAYINADGAKIAILDTIGGAKMTSDVSAQTTTNSNGDPVDLRVNGAIASSDNNKINGTIEFYSGTVIGTAKRGGAFSVYKGEFNMYGGIIANSKCINDNANGGAVWCANAADVDVTISGGLISNCQNTKGSSGSIALLRGDFTMDGGMIQGGQTKNNGGNITLSGGGTHSISNAIIRGGSQTNTAQAGGNILIAGVSNVTISNSTICAGTATGNGGNIAATAAANITINNSAIYDGGAVDGGNIYSIGAVTLNNVTLANGTATGNGGNIAVNAAVALNASNAHFAGGSAKNNGGSVYSLGAVELDKVSVVGGNASTNGGNIYAENNITVKNNSTIDGGTAVSGGSIYATGNITLTESTVRGGTASTYGGNIYMGGGNTLDIDNSVVADGTATGTATEATTEENPTNTGYGGNIYSNHASAKLLMDNTEVSNGYAAIKGTDKGRGGNIYFNNGSLVLNTCTFNGGSAYYGGSIYAASAADLDNVTITGGNATDAGGGFYHNRADKDVSLDNVTVTNCVAGTNGGNVRFRAAANVTSFKDVTLTNGKAGIKGGNLSIETPLKYILVENLEATGGQAKEYGGNIYVESAAAFDMTGGTVSAGTAGKDGGNLFIADSVTDESVVLTNVSFLNGHAYAETAERHESSDNIYAAVNIVLDGVQVSGNSNQNELGSGVYATKKVTLKNATVVGSKDEPISGSLYLKNAEATLEVDESFSGTVVLSPYWIFGHTTEIDPKDENKVTNYATLSNGGFEPYGQILPIAEATGDFSANGGKLYMGDHKTSDKIIWSYGMPEIKLHNETMLRVDNGVVLENAEGAKFYSDPAVAVNKYEDGNVLKFASNSNIEIALNNREYIIDTNGLTSTVTGTATVKGFDSNNVTGAAAGMMNIKEGSNIKADPVYVVDGNQYVTIDDGFSASFHYIKMDITKVNLRTGTYKDAEDPSNDGNPENGGIYYKGVWTCDDALTEYINDKKLDFGIVVSDEKMPDENFATENTENNVVNLYSVFQGGYDSEDKPIFQSGEENTSTLIKNIMKKGLQDKNAGRCATKIHAMPYLQLGEGEYIVGGEGVSLSMMDVLKKIDDAMGEEGGIANPNANILIEEFYEVWKADGLAKAIDESGYTFNNIFQAHYPAETPEQDAG